MMSRACTGAEKNLLKGFLDLHETSMQNIYVCAEFSYPLGEKHE